MPTTYSPTCEYVISADGTRIFSEAVGDPTKPAIVFIHGFQLSSVAFDPIFDDPKWTDNLYLIRYDTRGHGRSDKPTDDIYWTSNRLAEDFDAVIQKHKVFRPFVAGWSLGATHITDILSFHPPSYLTGVMVLNGTLVTGPHIADLVTPVVDVYLGPLLQSTDVDVYQKGALYFLEVCVEGLPYHLHQRWLGDIVVQPRAVTNHLVKRLQDESGLLKAAQDPNLPKLLLLCEKDRLINNDALRRYVEDWKNCKTVVLPKAGHTSWIGHPELFREAILGWIDEVTQDGDKLSRSDYDI